jgi:uncharacterized protein DUF5670
MVVMQGRAALAQILPSAGWHERCSIKGAFGSAQDSLKKEISIMLWTILVILLVLWLIGLLSHVGGGLIHLLLVVAVVILIINLVTGRRAV